MLMTNLLYSELKPNEHKKNVFKELLMFSLNSTLSFRNFKWNCDFWDFTNFLESNGMESLTNIAKCP